MKIFLKSTDTNAVECIMKTGETCESLRVFQNQIQHTKHDKRIDERLTQMQELVKELGFVGYEKSNKAEFMEAYKNAKNAIKTFADQLILK